MDFLSFLLAALMGLIAFAQAVRLPFALLINLTAKHIS